MVAIGFVAVWSILSNVLATLVILIWRPFNVGEKVEILPEGIEGQVIDINFVYTILKSDDGKKTAIPNNLFAQKFIRRSSLRTVPKRTLAEQLASDQPLD
jgi:small-conductance mechanosensitive channel